MPKIGTALGPRSIPGCLLSLSACNMEAIGGGRKDGVPIKEIVRPPIIAGNLSVTSFKEKGSTSLAPVTRRSLLDLLLPVLDRTFRGCNFPLGSARLSGVCERLQPVKITAGGTS
jgi:hypothetical protein